MIDILNLEVSNEQVMGFFLIIIVAFLIFAKFSGMIEED